MTNSARCALYFGAVILLGGCGSPQPPAGTAGVGAQNDAIHRATTRSKTFAYTGGEQSFKVPAGITSLDVDALGAAGGGRVQSYVGLPGRGGRVKATIPVKPGQTLFIFVGGTGQIPGQGFNGGGGGGWRGGGATDVRDGRKLSDRLVVAGGGGGLGAYTGGGGPNGGGGGGRKGGNGQLDSTGEGEGGSGLGGTQIGGGAGGVGGTKHAGAGAPGALGVGGTGGIGYSTYFDAPNGGGGGGGFYGGGGGGGGSPLGTGGAGGGGSGYAEPTATNVRMWRNWRDATGNGLLVLSW